MMNAFHVLQTVRPGIRGHVLGSMDMTNCGFSSCSCPDNLWQLFCCQITVQPCVLGHVSNALDQTKCNSWTINEEMICCKFLSILYVKCKVLQSHFLSELHMHQKNCLVWQFKIKRQGTCTCQCTRIQNWCLKSVLLICKSQYSRRIQG